MLSCFRSFQITLPIGDKEISTTGSIPINGNICLLPIDQNQRIKKIYCYAVNNSINNFLEFWDIRFQGLNRNGSLITQNAGIILNPISGDWGNIFIKDTILDFVLSSKKNDIDFNEGILLGGVRPLSISLKFSVPLAQLEVISFITNIQYE